MIYLCHNNITNKIPRAYALWERRCMTGEEWKIVEEDLKIIGNPVKLTIDNYDITLTLGQITTYKNGIFIYINGLMKGIWLTSECEERKRFLQKHEHNLYDNKTNKQISKMSKKRRAELGLDDRLKYVSYTLYWTSFKQLKKHFISNNENISLN